MALAVQGSGDLAGTGDDLAQATRGVLFGRWAALAIDLTLIGLVGAVVGNVFGVDRVISGSTLFSFTTATRLDWPWPWAVMFACFAIPESLFGTTPGKVLMGLRIARTDGSRPGPATLAVRNLFRIPDLLGIWVSLVVVLPLPLLGGFVMLMTPLRQRLGDLAAGTVVVDRHHPLVAGWTPLPSLGIRITLLCLPTVLSIAGLLAFDYYGRPPLVIQGMRNTGHLGSISADLQLGSPTWHAGSVTYPDTYVDANGRRCSGEIVLRWAGFVEGWAANGWSATCKPQG